MVCHGSVTRVFTNIFLNFDTKQSSKFNIPNATPLLLQLDQDLVVKNWRLLGEPAKIEALMKKVENELK